jgi:hypothetical protein
MTEAARFPYLDIEPSLAEASRLPYLPLRLASPQQTLEVSGLLDTGATVNVIPYGLGLQLGFVWEQQTTPVHLSGNLAELPARVVLLSATVATFPPVRLAFAWTEAESVPLLLGQVNFFLEFDVCFFRTQSVFEVRAKPKS